jgi:hypothetical protein
MDRTLRSISVNVLLCIEVAMELVVGYQPEGTYYRCCFVLSGEMYSVGEVAIAIMKALAPKAHVPADEGVLLLIVALPELLFLVQFIATWSGLFSPSPFL